MKSLVEKECLSLICAFRCPLGYARTYDTLSMTLSCLHTFCITVGYASIKIIVPLVHAIFCALIFDTVVFNMECQCLVSLAKVSPSLFPYHAAMLE